MRALRRRHSLPAITLMIAFARPASGLAAQRVFCYGDSLTAGTSPPLDDLYPYAPTLEQALGASNAIVRHRGLPGATAEMMLQYADDEQRGLRSLLKRSQPSLAIILAGTNDLGYNSESTPIVSAVCALHELAHALEIPTLAVGIPPSAYQTMQSEAAELANMVNRELRGWCLDRTDRCFYVDHPVTSWSRGDARWAPDGLHFSAEGYRATGQGLAPFVAERLSQGARALPSRSG